MTSPLSSLAPLRELLAESTLFSNVEWESVVPVLEDCCLMRLPASEQLIERGVSDDSLYIVLEGELEVFVGVGDEPLTTIGPGDSVGEIAALDHQPRSAAVSARKPSTVLKIESDDFWRLMSRSHQVALNMLHVLSERLRGNNAKIIDTRRLQELYRRSATTDALTGLYNRRGLDELGERLLKRLSLKKSPLSLLMLDVDHFKRFNDTHGHQAGDFVLFAVAKVLRAGVRPTDFVARYGGEEFTVLLPETPLDGACVAAERVREAIKSTPLELPDGTKLPQVTASLGAAQLMENESLAELMERADDALYRAKRGGRDRVCAFRPDLEHQ